MKQKLPWLRLFLLVLIFATLVVVAYAMLKQPGSPVNPSPSPIEPHFHP